MIEQEEATIAGPGGRLRVLFLTSPVQDFLADSIFHGLRSWLGSNVIDSPETDRYYACSEFDDSGLHGRGFTLYRLLRNVGVDRSSVRQRLSIGEFDLVIISDIWRMDRTLGAWLPFLSRDRTIILDGADSPAMYPYHGKWLRRPHGWLLPRAHTRFLYFKREWTPETLRRRWFGIPLERVLPRPRTLRPVAFSIPAEHIVHEPPYKTRLLARHVVDPEVAARVPGSATHYLFERQEDYFSDLKRSRFGVTTKRAGWDCLRHYEIAANGCVPCFRNLDLKPTTCAPHGLDSSNCVIYRTAAQLLDRIHDMDEGEYQGLQMGALEWARRNTTVERAKQVVREWSEEFDHTRAGKAVGSRTAARWRAPRSPR